MRTLTLLLLSTAAFAQTGAIRGTISDEFEVPVSGASVQVKDAAGKLVQATSTAAGEYTVDPLPAGAYEVTVTALTMKNFVKKEVAVRAGETARLNVKLAGASLGTLGEDDRFTAAALRRLGSAPPSGPAPRLPDGKPDLSGFWVQPAGRGAAAGARPEQAEPLPWADAIRQERLTSNLRDIPTARCLPLSITSRTRVKFVLTPSMLLMLYSEAPPRQIFLDGRGHPQELNPTWQGDSVGHWEGDTLVVDTAGLNGLAWVIEAIGLPFTEMMHVTERYRRTDLGHLEYETTIEDPAALRKPWTQKRIYNLDPKEDIEEIICAENNLDVEHLVGK